MVEQKKAEEHLLPPYYPPTPPGLLFVLSGPSGVGKDAVINRLKENACPWHFTVTMTTRAPRPGEVNGLSYFFVSQQEFDTMKLQGELLESAVVHEFSYGTPMKQVREALNAGKDVFLKIDVQGATQVKQRVPDAVFIFLGPEDMDTLIARMVKRGTESQEQLATRIRNAFDEMRQMKDYDYLVINRQHHLDEAVDQIESIVSSEKHRIRPRNIEL
jgi:guanylate kinase